jgi:hypothetical protein
MAESLVEAVLRQRDEQRRRDVEAIRAGADLVRSYLKCTACGGTIRDDNETKLCRGCQRQHRSTMKCRCGCGRPIDLRNVEGYANNCPFSIRVRWSRRWTPAGRRYSAKHQLTLGF